MIPHGTVDSRILTAMIMDINLTNIIRKVNPITRNQIVNVRIQRRKSFSAIHEVERYPYRKATYRKTTHQNDINHGRIAWKLHLQFFIKLCKLY